MNKEINEEMSEEMKDMLYTCTCPCECCVPCNKCGQDSLSQDEQRVNKVLDKMRRLGMM